MWDFPMCEQIDLEVRLRQEMSLFASHNDYEYTIIPGFESLFGLWAQMVHYFGYFKYMFLLSGHTMCMPFLNLE